MQGTVTYGLKGLLNGGDPAGQLHTYTGDWQSDGCYWYAATPGCWQQLAVLCCAVLKRCAVPCCPHIHWRPAERWLLLMGQSAAVSLCMLPCCTVPGCA